MPTGLVRATIAALALASIAVPAAATHSLGVMPQVPLISPEALKRRLDAGESVVLIDLRPTPEYERGRLPGADSIPLPELRRRHAEIPRAEPVILYCGCRPGEEWHAYELLHARGYRNVSVLAGGFRGWVEHGFPLASAPGRRP